MDYEIVNVLRPEDQNWQMQLKRLQKTDGKLITLAPDPIFSYKKENSYKKAINVVDYVTGRSYDPDTSLFFNKVPTVDNAEVYMNNDGTISIISEGETIGMMRTYPGTRRLVKDLTYLNEKGDTDYLEEYAYDGKLFSRIFYFDNKIQQIAFFDDDQNVKLRFYFYDGVINTVTIVDGVTQKVERQFDTLGQFFQAIVAEIVKSTDRVGIGYMGVELDVLAQTKSNNTLYLDESVFDETKNVKGNLQAIIDNRISWIQQVYISEHDYASLLENGADMKKLRPTKS